MDSSHTLLLGLVDRRRSLTRILMLVEGRGFTIRGVRSQPMEGAHAEIEVRGDSARLGHLASRLAQLPDVYSVSTSGEAAAPPAPRQIRLERLRVHAQAEAGNATVTDVTLSLELNGVVFTAAGDGPDLASAAADAVRAALRPVCGAELDRLHVSDCVTSTGANGASVAVTAHDGYRQHTGTAHDVNPWLATVEAVLSTFDSALPSPSQIEDPALTPA